MIQSALADIPIEKLAVLDVPATHESVEQAQNHTGEVWLRAAG